MKGQVTVEYLLLFSIGLALIAFAVAALAVIKGAESDLTNLEKAEIAAASLKSAGDEVCALGDGNSKVVDANWDVNVNCNGNAITVTSYNRTSTSGIERCDATCGDKNGTRFLVKNDAGTVDINAYTP